MAELYQQPDMDLEDVELNQQVYHLVGMVEAIQLSQKNTMELLGQLVGLYQQQDIF